MARGLKAAVCVFIIALTIIAFTGCTSVGIHSTAARQRLDFGANDSVALCLYLDAGISEEQGRTLVQEAWQDDGPLYGLHINVVSVTAWPRPAFMMDGIIDALRREPLKPGCDRILALINRHVGDFVWGVLQLPEYLGAVDDETLTRGYAIARRITLNQMFESPRSVVRHEIYHLLGCDEHFRMARCYEQIARLKRWKREHATDFLPGWDLVNRRMIVSREAVNERLRAALNAEMNESLNASTEVSGVLSTQ